MSTLGTSLDLSESFSDDWARIEEKYVRSLSPLGHSLLHLSPSADRSGGHLPFDISAEASSVEGRFGVVNTNDFDRALSPPPSNLSSPSPTCAKASFNAEKLLSENRVIPSSEPVHALRDRDACVSPRLTEGGASSSSAPCPPLQEAADSPEPAAVELSVRSVPEKKTSVATRAACSTALMPQKDNETFMTASSAPLREESMPSTNSVATKQPAAFPSTSAPAAADGPLATHTEETTSLMSNAPTTRTALPAVAPTTSTSNAPTTQAAQPAGESAALTRKEPTTTRTAQTATHTAAQEYATRQEPPSSTPSALRPDATTSFRPTSAPNLSFGLTEAPKPPPALVRTGPRPPSPSGAPKFTFAPVQAQVAPVAAHDGFVVQADMVAQLRDVLQQHFPCTPHEIPGSERAAAPAAERAAGPEAERAAAPGAERAVAPAAERAAGPGAERIAAPQAGRASAPAAERDASEEPRNHGERDAAGREYPWRERTPPMYLPRYVEYRPRDLTPSRYDYAHAPPLGSYHQPPYGYVYRDMPPYDYPPPYAYPLHPHMPPEYAYAGGYNREPSPGRPPVRPQFEPTPRGHSPAQPRVDNSAPVESCGLAPAESRQLSVQAAPPSVPKASASVAAMATGEQSSKMVLREERVTQVEREANPVSPTATHSSGALMCIVHNREFNYFHAGRMSFHCELCREDLHSTEVSRMQGLKEAFREHLSDIEGILPELEAKKQTLKFHKASADQCVDDVKARVAEAERDARGEFEAVIDHLRSVESVKLAVLGEDRQMFLQSIEDINAVSNSVKTGKHAHSKAEIVTFLKRARQLRLTCETLLSKPVKNVQVSLDDIKFEVQERTKKLREYAVMRELLEMKNEAIWTMQKDLRGYRKESNDIRQVILHLENYLQMATKALAYKCHYCSVPFNAQNANSRCTVIPDYVDHHTYGAHYWIPSSDSTQQSTDRPTSSHQRFLDRSRCRQTPAQTSCEPIDKPFVDALLRRIAHTVQDRGVHIRDAFAAFDFNNDGRVSRPEFFEAMRRLRLNLDDREINAMFRRLDANDDGVVSYEEFIDQLHAHRADYRTETDTRELLHTVGRQIRAKGVRVADAFSLFDHNSDGFLSREEFTKAVKAMQLPVRDADFDCLLTILDPRKTDQLKIDEFVDRMSQ